MNIDIVVTQYEAGGAQKAAINLANLLFNFGKKPRLVFLYKRSDVDLGVNPLIDVVFLQGDVSRQKKIFLTVTKLRSLWRSSRPDVIVSFTHYSNIFASISAKTLSIPIVISHRNPRTAYSRITKLIDSLLYRSNFYSVVTYVSESTRKTFLDAYAGDCQVPSYVVRNCVNNQVVQNSDGLGGGYLIAIGRLTGQKNHSVLIRALEKSSYTGKLYIVGQGPLLDDLRRLTEELGVADRVVFKGVIANSEVQGLLKCADAFLMPSLYEGMSNALLEAVVNKVFTIVSDAPAQREVVETEVGCYGLIVPAKSPDDWTLAFNQLPCKVSDDIHQLLVERYAPQNFYNGFLEAIASAMINSDVL
jgi:glycosyltransferase involved in cell wall biosynthesis